MKKMAQISFNRFLDGLPAEHRKPVRYAVYNLLTVGLLIIGYNVYLILSPYCKPLLWAVLVGSVLHPFKYKLADLLRNWCTELQPSNVSFVLSFMKGICNCVDSSSMGIAKKLLDDWKQVAVLVFFVFISPWLYTIWFHTYTAELLRHLHRVLEMISVTLNVFQYHYVFTVLVAYIISMLIFWKPEYSGRIRKVSALLWFPFSAYLSSFSSFFRVPIFIALQLLACFGYLLHLSELRSRFQKDGIHLTFWGAAYLCYTNETEWNATSSAAVENEDSVSGDQLAPSSTPKNVSLEVLDSPTPKSATMLNVRSPWSAVATPPAPVFSPVEVNLRFLLKRSGLPEGLFLRNKVRSALSFAGSSSYYFKGLFWACTLVMLSRYIFIWPVLLFCIAYYCLRQIGVYFGVWAYAASTTEDLWSNLRPRCVAVIPMQIQSINTFVSISGAYFRQGINESVDGLSCLIVMFALLLFAMGTSVFIVYQIYSESTVMIQLFPTVLNNTKSLLPPAWDGTVELWMEDAYSYGRKGISSMAKQFLNGTDTILEQHVLELWDRIFQSWLAPEVEHGPNVDAKAVVLSWQSLLDIFKRSPDSLSMMTSLWGPVAEYASVAMGLLATFFSMVVGGGTYVFNSLLNLLVFLTALFYLLSSSGSTYKPIEVISKLVPGSDLGEALSAAVDQVFIASFKMAVFYGLWAWLTHTFLGAKIVFLPSAVAALLAVAPLMPPYLACIPAVLEIWFLQGRAVAGITLFILQISPMLFGVDTAIYTEIKSGHPYLTCLSVAGGILYMGIEGALLGPLLLCWILCLQFSGSSNKIQ